jgi:hypothetical protein
MPAKRTTRAPVRTDAAPTSVWADKLASMQDEAKASMANYDPSGNKVLEGIFVAKETCRPDLTGNGDMKIVRTFYVLEGEHANSSITDGLTIENNEIGLHNARRWVELHGIEWPEDNLPELENILNQINEMASTVEIRSKASKPTDDGRIFTNVFVNRILDGSEGAAPVDGVDPQVDEQGNEIPLVEEPYDDGTQGADDQAQAAADADEARRQELLIMCSSHNITDVDDSMDIDTVCQILSGFKWTADDNLTAEENTLLEENGLSNTIERKPTPPAARRPAPAPAARPAARPSARPAPAPAARPVARPAARPAAPAARPAQRVTAPAARARIASGKK